MKNNKKKKAFTIVELVIVIAVIAILAAVLIPTFASLIDKANRSADIQAVAQMNIALAAESAFLDPDEINFEKVIDILSDAGYDSENRLKPISKGHRFYWHATYNIILLAKEETEEALASVVYPTDNQTLVRNFVSDLRKTGTDQVLYDLAGSDKLGDDNTQPGPAEPNPEPGDGVVSVTLSGMPTGDFYIGQSFTLAATVLPDYATNKDVTWSSDNESVATVDQNGKVIAMDEGEATIKAASAADPSKYALCTVTVKEVEAISLPTSVILYRDGTGDSNVTLSPVVYGEDGPIDIDSNYIAWTIDDPTVAKIGNETGSSNMVDALNYGITTVTVTAGGKTVKCKVTVADSIFFWTEQKKLSTYHMQSGVTDYVSVDLEGNTEGTWTFSVTGIATCRLNDYDEYELKSYQGGTTVLTFKASNGTYIACSTIVIEQDIRTTDERTAAEKLVEALNNGGKIKLDENVTMPGSLAQQIAVGQDTVLDLNGHALTLAGDFYGINVFGSLSITNGSIITNRTSQLHACPGGSLSLENVNMTQNGQIASLTNHGGTVTINGGKFTAISGGNLISNGTVNGVTYEGTMTITGTEFEFPGSEFARLHCYYCKQGYDSPPVGDCTNPECNNQHLRHFVRDDAAICNRVGTLTLNGVSGLGDYVENYTSGRRDFVYTDGTDTLEAT